MLKLTIGKLERDKKIKINILIKLILFLKVVVVPITAVHTQTYPVTSILTTNNYGTPYLEDFLIDNPQDLLSTLILNDDDYESIDVSLRIHLYGEGISIITDPNFVGDLYTLFFNVPQTLTGADLAQYFNPDNLIFQGISREAFIRGGKLPEGFYSLCLEAVDPFRLDQNSVSNLGCSTLTLETHQPPTIVSLIGQHKFLSAQNYYFDWVDNHIGFAANYNLFIYEKSEGLTVDEVIDFVPPIMRWSVGS